MKHWLKEWWPLGLAFAAFGSMQKRHRDAIATFEEKWGVKWEEVKRG